MKKLLALALTLLSSAAQAQQTWNNPSGSVFQTNITLGLQGTLTGALTFRGLTSGTLIQTVQAAAGTPTVTWGTSTGTPAVTASSPLAITTATGNITCATCGVTSGTLAQFAATTSAELAGVISDETGSGPLVFATASTLTNPRIATVIGGDAVGSSLSLRTTTAVGTTDQINFQVGNNGATNAGNIRNGGFWNIGATDVAPDSLLTIMANTAATVVPTTGTHLHIVGADAVATRLLLDNFGSANVINARHASGTLASKTATASGSVLFAFGVAGWDGTSAYYSSSGINFISTETFSATAGGTYIAFNITPSTTHALAEGMRLQASAGLTVGSSFATDPGAGVIMATNGFRSGANSGQSVTTTVRASGGAADCTLIFTGGLKTGGTC